MPYPFVLPTTSAISFSSSFTCDSHPSLPLTASTQRNVVRTVLKQHKRLPPSSQPPHLPTIASALAAYLPYLLALEAAHTHQPLATNSPELISLLQRSNPPLTIEWRPTLSSETIANPRVKIHTPTHELAFLLTTTLYTAHLLARAALHPLAHPNPQNPTTHTIGSAPRQTAIASATRHLLDAASLADFLASRLETPSASHLPPPPCADITASTARAHVHLALAEATLLAVLKDDPYPAVVAQGRNAQDKEWMYKAPDIPKVRAHLFARLCLAAAEHAGKAHGLCAWQAGPGVVEKMRALQIRGKKNGGGDEDEDGGLGGSGSGSGKLSEGFVRYLEDLRRTSRAKACRFFGIDAELGGQTGDAIGWLHAALQELGVEVKDSSKKASGLSRLKKEWTEKREDRKVEKGTTWGADAGKLEETRVVEMLESKWTKQNDTMFTQAITPAGTLLAQMPSAREIHSLKPYQVPVLDSSTLAAMRAPPNRSDDFGDDQSSDEEIPIPKAAPGAYPGSSSGYY